MNRLTLKQKMKKSVLGRAFCRLVGEDRGAVMMEYVIVAVLIAAAAAAAVAYFGKDISAMFGVAGNAATGNVTGAETARTDAKDQAETYKTKAKSSNEQFSDVDTGSGSGGTTGGTK